MNKILRHFPVDRLPAEMRGDWPKDGFVKIEMELETGPVKKRPIAHLVGSAPSTFSSDQEVLDYIAELRADR